MFMRNVRGRLPVIFAMAALPLTIRAAAITADVVVLMDESGSMSGEQNWIKSTVMTLDGLLNGAGLTGNRYGTLGFSVGTGPGLTRSINVGGSQFGTATDFQSVSYSTAGGTEDGWAAVNAANAYGFRGGAARNYILISDEDRDNAQAGLTYGGILAGMTSTQTLLNAVLDASFRCGDGTAALGIDSKGNGYVANGTGGFSTCSGGTAVSGFGPKIADYVNLAVGTGGAAWDLNYLRNGGADASSFSSAFIAIKVNEITQQPVITPEPATMALIGPVLIGIGAIVKRRKRTQPQHHTD